MEDDHDGNSLVGREFPPAPRESDAATNGGGGGGKSTVSNLS